MKHDLDRARLLGLSRAAGDLSRAAGHKLCAQRMEKAVTAGQFGLVVGLVISLPIIVALAWWGIKHGSGGNT